VKNFFSLGSLVGATLLIVCCVIAFVDCAVLPFVCDSPAHCTAKFKKKMLCVAGECLPCTDNAKCPEDEKLLPDGGTKVHTPDTGISIDTPTEGSGQEPAVPEKVVRDNSSTSKSSPLQMTSTEEVVVKTLLFDGSGNIYIFGGFRGDLYVQGTKISPEPNTQFNNGGLQIFVLKLSPSYQLVWSFLLGMCNGCLPEKAAIDRSPKGGNKLYASVTVNKQGGAAGFLMFGVVNGTKRATKDPWALFSARGCKSCKVTGLAFNKDGKLTIAGQFADFLTLPDFSTGQTERSPSRNDGFITTFTLGEKNPNKNIMTILPFGFVPGYPTATPVLLPGQELLFASPYFNPNKWSLPFVPGTEFSRGGRKGGVVLAKYNTTTARFSAATDVFVAGPLYKVSLGTEPGGGVFLSIKGEGKVGKGNCLTGPDDPRGKAQLSLMYHDKALLCKWSNYSQADKIIPEAFSVGIEGRKVIHGGSFEGSWRHSSLKSASFNSKGKADIFLADIDLAKGEAIKVERIGGEGNDILSDMIFWKKKLHLLGTYTAPFAYQGRSFGLPAGHKKGVFLVTITP